MKKLYAIALVVVVALAPVFNACAVVVDKIVVVVNTEVITQGEIDQMMVPVYQHYKEMFQGNDLIRKLDEARQMILGQLIEEKLILSQAKKMAIEVDEKEVAERIDEAEKRLGSREMLERALADQRMTLKDLKQKYRNQIMSKKLVDQKVGSKIFITPVDVSEYYREHPEEFVQPESVRVRCILIKPKPNLSDDDAAELANKVLAQIRSGTDFGDLAGTYSDGPGTAEGGNMGLKKRGDLLPAIENIVFGLNAGDTSEVVKTDLGYFIFRIDEKTASKAMAFSEARRNIEDAIFRERAKEKMRGWIEDMKKNAYIAFR